MKKMLSMLLVIAVLLCTLVLASCDKKKDKDKDLNPGGNTDTSETQGNAGTIDNGDNKDTGSGEEGKLNVGEDTEGDKYGEFVPYK